MSYQISDPQADNFHATILVKRATLSWEYLIVDVFFNDLIFLITNIEVHLFNAQ